MEELLFKTLVAIFYLPLVLTRDKKREGLTLGSTDKIVMNGRSFTSK
jgi:hypothetical protein